MCKTNSCCARGDEPTDFYVHSYFALQATVPACFKTSVPINPRFFSNLMASLHALGWEKVLSFDEDSRSIVLAALDARGRSHELTLILPTDFPKERPISSCHLPEAFEFEYDSVLTWVLFCLVALPHKTCTHAN